MKEFIWKVCCLIWHFDERVIKEYKKSLLPDLIRKEEIAWNRYKITSRQLAENFDADFGNYDMAPKEFQCCAYGENIERNINRFHAWNELYDNLRNLYLQLGMREEFEKLRNSRDN